jgi:tubulin-like protein CetZ
MRVLAIGLGGAGGRLADALYRRDRAGSVSCVEPAAIDTDALALRQLSAIPAEHRLYYPPMGPGTIDLEQVLFHLKRQDASGVDALLLCVGAGGETARVAPALVDALKAGFAEPVLVLAALPQRSEGRRIAAQAGEALDALLPRADAVLLFDNETFAARMPAGGRDPSPTLYAALNVEAAKRIGLLLRAGEAGREVGQVVVDAGEVLGTLAGQGFAAVGYAFEPIREHWLVRLLGRPVPFLAKPDPYEGAARIVDLAKKACYEEVSVPCDLTGATKALLLLAGPSRELSMKGFTTVQRWLDRTIAGFELRSGDYPVDANRVGVVVLLAGLRNVPRVEELREIAARERRPVEIDRIDPIAPDTPSPSE